MEAENIEKLNFEQTNFALRVKVELGRQTDENLTGKGGKKSKANKKVWVVYF